MTCLNHVGGDQDDERRTGPARPPTVPRTVVMGLDLTRREVDVLDLIARGASTHDIAETLFLSVNSVKTHTRTLFRKLGLGSRLQVAVWVWSRGWEADDPDR